MALPTEFAKSYWPPVTLASAVGVCGTTVVLALGSGPRYFMTICPVLYRRAQTASQYRMKIISSAMGRRGNIITDGMLATAWLATCKAGGISLTGPQGGQRQHAAARETCLQASHGYLDALHHQEGENDHKQGHRERHPCNDFPCPLCVQ